MNKDNSSKTYNLEERTSCFGEEIIDFCKSIPINEVNRPIISQLVRAATSIGANYCEANGAASKRDFKNKLYICLKESKETKFWLRMVAKSNDEFKVKARNLWYKAHEFTKIFSQSLITLKNRT